MLELLIAHGARPDIADKLSLDRTVYEGKAKAEAYLRSLG